MSDVTCGNCGVEASGGNFCRNCGAPLVAAAPPAPPAPPAPAAAPVPPPAPAAPPAPQPYQPQPYQQPAAAYPPVQPYPPAPENPWAAQQPQQPPYAKAPSAPVPNPFAGMPVSDMVRDVAALVLLFSALAMPWDATEDGSGRWWVILATIISALSVAVPYLVTMRLVPGWTGAQSRLVKLVCFVPYAGAVVAALVHELMNVGEEQTLAYYQGYTGFVSAVEGGFGPAIVVGLVGALLALQARSSDLEPTGAADGAWRTAVFVLIGGGIAVVTLTALIAMATSFGDVLLYSDSAGVEDGPVVLVLGIFLGAIVSFALVLVLPFVGFLNGGREWARVLAVTGFAIVASAYLGGLGDESEPLFSATLERIRGLFGVFLVAAGIALLVSRPVQRRLASLPPIQSWVQTARHACTVLAVGLGLSAVARLLTTIGADEVGGTTIVSIVLSFVAAGAAFVVSAQLAGNPDQARKVVVAIVGGILVLAVVAIAVGRGGDGYGSIEPAEVVGWFAMPGLILWALLVPKEIRETFQPLATPPAAPASAYPQAPYPQAPAEQYPAQPQPPAQSHPQAPVPPAPQPYQQPQAAPPVPPAPPVQPPVPPVQPPVQPYPQPPAPGQEWQPPPA